MGLTGPSGNGPSLVRQTPHPTRAGDLRSTASPPKTFAHASSSQGGDHVIFLSAAAVDQPYSRPRPRARQTHAARLPLLLAASSSPPADTPSPPGSGPAAITDQFRPASTTVCAAGRKADDLAITVIEAGQR